MCCFAPFGHWVFRAQAASAVFLGIRQICIEEGIAQNRPKEGSAIFDSPPELGYPCKLSTPQQLLQIWLSRGRLSCCINGCLLHHCLAWHGMLSKYLSPSVAIFSQPQAFFSDLLSFNFDTQCWSCHNISEGPCDPSTDRPSTIFNALSQMDNLQYYATGQVQGCAGLQGLQLVIREWRQPFGKHIGARMLPYMHESWCFQAASISPAKNCAAVAGLLSSRDFGDRWYGSFLHSVTSVTINLQ